MGRVLVDGSVINPVPARVAKDLGAEIIKVEGPEGDTTRYTGPARSRDMAALFMGLNRNKRSITLDITRPEGAAIVRRLVERADVVIENMTPGALKRAGLDYESLREVNEQLVMVSQPIGGQTGPFAQKRGYGGTVNAMVGLEFITGYDPEEGMVGFTHTVADPNVAVVAATTVLAALHRRRATGRGEYIDLSMLRMAIETSVRQLSRAPPSLSSSTMTAYPVFLRNSKRATST